MQEEIKFVEAHKVDSNEFELHVDGVGRRLAINNAVRAFEQQYQGAIKDHQRFRYGRGMTFVGGAFAFSLGLTTYLFILFGTAGFTIPLSWIGVQEIPFITVPLIGFMALFLFLKDKSFFQQQDTHYLASRAKAFKHGLIKTYQAIKLGHQASPDWENVSSLVGEDDALTVLNEIIEQLCYKKESLLGIDALAYGMMDFYFGVKSDSLFFPDTPIGEGGEQLGRPGKVRFEKLLAQSSNPSMAHHLIHRLNDRFRYLWQRETRILQPLREALRVLHRNLEAQGLPTQPLNRDTSDLPDDILSLLSDYVEMCDEYAQHYQQVEYQLARGIIHHARFLDLLIEELANNPKIAPRDLLELVVSTLSVFFEEEETIGIFDKPAIARLVVDWMLPEYAFQLRALLVDAEISNAARGFGKGDFCYLPSREGLTFKDLRRKMTVGLRGAPITTDDNLSSFLLSQVDALIEEKMTQEMGIEVLHKRHIERAKHVFVDEEKMQPDRVLVPKDLQDPFRLFYGIDTERSGMQNHLVNVYNLAQFEMSYAYEQAHRDPEALYEALYDMLAARVVRQGDLKAVGSWVNPSEKVKDLFTHQFVDAQIKTIVNAFYAFCDETVYDVALHQGLFPYLLEKAELSEEDPLNEQILASFNQQNHLTTFGYLTHISLLPKADKLKTAKALSALYRSSPQAFDQRLLIILETAVDYLDEPMSLFDALGRYDRALQSQQGDAIRVRIIEMRWKIFCENDSIYLDDQVYRTLLDQLGFMMRYYAEQNTGCSLLKMDVFYEDVKDYVSTRREEQPFASLLEQIEALYLEALYPRLQAEDRAYLFEGASNLNTPDETLGREISKRLRWISAQFAKGEPIESLYEALALVGLKLLSYPETQHYQHPSMERIVRWDERMLQTLPSVDESSALMVEPITRNREDEEKAKDRCQWVIIALFTYCDFIRYAEDLDVTKRVLDKILYYLDKWLDIAAYAEDRTPSATVRKLQFLEGIQADFFSVEGMVKTNILLEHAKAYICLATDELREDKQLSCERFEAAVNSYLSDEYYVEEMVSLIQVFSRQPAEFLGNLDEAGFINEWDEKEHYLEQLCQHLFLTNHYRAVEIAKKLLKAIALHIPSDLKRTFMQVLQGFLAAFPDKSIELEQATHSLMSRLDGSITLEKALVLAFREKGMRLKADYELVIRKIQMNDRWLNHEREALWANDRMTDVSSLNEALIHPLVGLLFSNDNRKDYGLDYWYQPHKGYEMFFYLLEAYKASAQALGLNVRETYAQLQYVLETLQLKFYENYQTSPRKLVAYVQHYMKEAGQPPSHYLVASNAHDEIVSKTTLRAKYEESRVADRMILFNVYIKERVMTRDHQGIELYKAIDLVKAIGVLTLPPSGRFFASRARQEDLKLLLLVLNGIRYSAMSIYGEHTRGIKTLAEIYYKVAVFCRLEGYSLSGVKEVYTQLAEYLKEEELHPGKLENNVFNTHRSLESHEVNSWRDGPYTLTEEMQETKYACLGWLV